MPDTGRVSWFIKKMQAPMFYYYISRCLISPGMIPGNFTAFVRFHQVFFCQSAQWLKDHMFVFRGVSDFFLCRRLLWQQKITSFSTPIHYFTILCMCVLFNCVSWAWSGHNQKLQVSPKIWICFIHAASDRLLCSSHSTWWNCFRVRTHS